jgi:hypothetical protein
LPCTTEALTGTLVAPKEDDDVSCREFTNEIAQAQEPGGGVATALPRPTVLTVSVASSGVEQADTNNLRLKS